MKIPLASAPANRLFSDIITKIFAEFNDFSFIIYSTMKFVLCRLSSSFYGPEKFNEMKWILRRNPS